MRLRRERSQFSSSKYQGDQPSKQYPTEARTSEADCFIQFKRRIQKKISEKTGTLFTSSNDFLSPAQTSVVKASSRAVFQQMMAEMQEAKTFSARYFIRRPFEHAKLGTKLAVMEGTLTKIKLYLKKDVKVSRFYRLTKTKLMLYSSLYSKSLIKDKPVEQIQLRFIKQVKYQLIRGMDAQRNIVLLLYYKSGKTQQPVLKTRFGEEIQSCKLIFKRVTEAKDFLSLYFRLYKRS